MDASYLLSGCSDHSRAMTRMFKTGDPDYDDDHVEMSEHLNFVPTINSIYSSNNINMSNRLWIRRRRVARRGSTLDRLRRIDFRHQEMFADPDDEDNDDLNDDDAEYESEYDDASSEGCEPDDEGYSSIQFVCDEEFSDSSSESSLPDIMFDNDNDNDNDEPMFPVPKNLNYSSN